jgi:type I restriction enzyme S subunit
MSGLKKGWETKNLGELVDSGVVQLTRGKIISKKDMAAFPGTYPVYSSAKEDDGKFGEYGRFLFDEELITWSVDGGGALFHRRRHRFSVTNVGGVLRILKASVLDYRYLYYALTLRHSEITFDWVKKAHPSVIKQLYNDIPIPPLAEQQRIVVLLDEAFESIAIAKANAEKNVENARATFESHLEAVFAQRGPGWVEKRIDEIGRTQTGSTPKGADQSSYGDFIPFVKPGDFNLDGSLTYDNDGLSEHGANAARTVRNGSVLMVCIGATIGKCGYCDQDVTTNQQVNALTPSDGSFNRFLYYQMLTHSFQRSVIRASGQATLPIINKSKWSALQLWLPPFPAEQQSIAKKLDVLSSETQRLADLYTQKVAALDELKKSLLQRAFAGEL